MCSHQSVGLGDYLHGSIHHRGPANLNRAMVPAPSTSMPKLSGGIRTSQLGTKAWLHSVQKKPCSKGSLDPAELGFGISCFNPHAANKLSKGEICRKGFFTLKPGPGTILHPQNAQPSKHIMSLQPPAPIYCSWSFPPVLTCFGGAWYSHHKGTLFQLTKQSCWI